jgi:hypothetical protein
MSGIRIFRPPGWFSPPVEFHDGIRPQIQPLTDRWVIARGNQLRSHRRQTVE